MKSPFTGKEMKKCHEQKTWKFRGENFKYTRVYWECEDTRERFTTDESDTESYTQVTNQYRVKHGIPSTEEIIQTREKYKISAAKITKILGFGQNQWSMYEKGEVPSLSNGKMIRLIMNPAIFLSLLNCTDESINEKDRQKIKENVQRLLQN